MRYYSAPEGKERGTRFGLACLVSFYGVFPSDTPVLISEDLARGPGVVGGFATALAGFLARRRACLTCSRKITNSEIFLAITNWVYSFVTPIYLGVPNSAAFYKV